MSLNTPWAFPAPTFLLLGSWKSRKKNIIFLFKTCPPLQAHTVNDPLALPAPRPNLRSVPHIPRGYLISCSADYRPIRLNHSTPYIHALLLTLPNKICYICNICSCNPRFVCDLVSFLSLPNQTPSALIQPDRIKAKRLLEQTERGRNTISHWATD